MPRYLSPEEPDVLAANSAFYDAFARRDVAAMDQLWARVAPVACIHPGWDALRGREEVMESWRAILGGRGAPDVRCAAPVAQLHGETAIVICREILSAGRLVATNVFQREGGLWKMVHHQASPLARDADEEDEDEDEDGPSGMLN